MLVSEIIECQLCFLHAWTMDVVTTSHNYGRSVLPLKKVKGALSGLKQFLATESPLKDEKCFLFHLKSSFHSRDI